MINKMTDFTALVDALAGAADIYGTDDCVEARAALDAYVRALIERQAAELEQCRRDAERYGWLRTNYFIFETVPVALNDVADEAGFDAAIDAALRESQGDGT